MDGVEPTSGLISTIRIGGAQVDGHWLSQTWGKVIGMLDKDAIKYGQKCYRQNMFVGESARGLYLVNQERYEGRAGLY